MDVPFADFFEFHVINFLFNIAYLTKKQFIFNKTLHLFNDIEKKVVGKIRIVGLIVDADGNW
jgi:hypothetical protein